MIAALALATETSLIPTDDVWVYMHAPDQTSDVFLRAWGSEDGSFGADEFGTVGSWSVIKFDVSTVPTGKTLKSASLMLWVPEGDLGISTEESKAQPLEVRRVGSDWEEENYTFSKAKTVVPGAKKEDVFGTVAVEDPGSGEAFAITIDLTKEGSTFAEHLKAALSTQKKDLGLALTTKLAPGMMGDGGIYKVYSRSAERQYRPKLTLVFTD